MIVVGVQAGVCNADGAVVDVDLLRLAQAIRRNPEEAAGAQVGAP